LNVMRSAGVVAEFGQGDKSRRGQDDKK
ncbi:ATP F0F1 synthase subunit I, partial [Mesorhizobium sp. M7A.F.Ca.CA.004.04.1.1]